MRPGLTACVLTGVCVVFLCSLPTVRGEDAARTVQLLPEDATLHCLGVRWFIAGDDNGNARVTVRYRKAGAATWKDAMPLFRVESAALEERAPPRGQTIHAGSLFYLTPDTEYEVKLSLHDPDGGDVEKIFKQRTWSEPLAPPPRRTLHVVPGSGGGSGSRSGPYRGLAAAAAAARPGDLFLLHKGVYSETLRLKTSGTAEAPIVWRGAGDGEAVIDGQTKSAVVAWGRKHIFLEKLSLRNARVGIMMGGCQDIVIRRCHLYKVGTGISGRHGKGQRRTFIADNHIEGIESWPRDKSLKTAERRGVELSGTGHVVCYNRIHGFRDAVDTNKPWPVRAIDIHNNEIYDCYDDAIEFDFSEHNVRAYRNRITNTGMGFSFQPVRGGPVYALHNALYNVAGETFKLHLTPTNRKSPNWREGPHRTSGGVLLHNTVLKHNVAFRVWSNEGPIHHFYARNNLLIGRPAGYAIEITCPMRWADFDYNGYAKTRRFAYWNEKRYGTIRDFAAAVGCERHGVVIPGGEEALFAARVKARANPRNQHFQPGENDLRLKGGAAAIDRGVVLPNINDGYQGAAPDLGAFEFGLPLPVYGPRPEGYARTPHPVRRR